MTSEGIISVSDLSSSLQHFSWPDYLVFALMLISCVLIGIYFGFLEKSKTKNQEKQHNGDPESPESAESNYLVGGRKMKIIPIALSLVASHISGISLLGISTEIYVYGTQFAFLFVSVFFAYFLSWYVFLPVFHDLKLTSAYEYLELRFNKNVRLFGSILFTIGTTIWLPIVIFVPALAFNQVTGVNIHIITPIVCIVCIFYTCVGGLKAVVWTDVIQSFVMVGSLLLVMIKGTADIGGLGVLWDRNKSSGRLELPEFTIDPTVRHSFFALLIGGATFWTNSTCCSQNMVQRFLALPKRSDVKKSLLAYFLLVITIQGCCIYNGLLIYATYHDCDPLSTKLAKAKDQLLPLLVMEILGIFPGLPGLFVAGVFSAALSSLSTGLNSMAAIALEDFYKPLLRRPLTEKEVSIFMKSVVIFFGIICVALVFVVERMGTVLQLSMTLQGIASGPMFGIFFIGLCLPWINGKSALTGGIASLFAMGWLCTKAQLALTSGDVFIQQKSVTIEGCTYEFDRGLLYTSSNHTIVHPGLNEHTTQMYHISYLWYIPLGALLTVTLSGISALFFGTLNPKDVDQKLLSPFVKNFIKPRKLLSVQPDIKEKESFIHAYETKCCIEK